MPFSGVLDVYPDRPLPAVATIGRAAINLTMVTY
jgi:hypothetical protein